MANHISRRSIIFGGLGFIASGTLFHTLTRTTALNNIDLSRTSTVSAACIHERIGQKYIQQTSPKPTVSSLKEAIESRIKLPVACADPALSQQLKTEYTNQETVEINGWVLPKTAVLLSSYGVENMHVS